MEKEAKEITEVDYYGMTEKEYWVKNKHLYNPHEWLSDKLKRYTLINAQTDLTGTLPPYHNYIAKARKAFNNSISVYKMSKEILYKIHTTSIDKMTDEEPKLFTKPFIIESHEKNGVLFGDINAIIGFYDNVRTENGTEKKFIFLFHTKPIQDKRWHDYAMLFSDQFPDNGPKKRLSFLMSNLFYFSPFEGQSFWDFDFVDYSCETFVKREQCDNCMNRKKCEGKDRRLPDEKYHFCMTAFYNNILSFLVVFNYLMEAENTPVRVTKTVEHSNYPVTKKGKIIEKTQDWIIKYMYIDNEKLQYKKNPDPAELDKEGLVATQANVRSHLKRQAYGPGHKDRKIIFIDNYIATKWVKEGDKKIIVKQKKKP